MHHLWHTLCLDKNAVSPTHTYRSLIQTFLRFFGAYAAERGKSMFPGHFIRSVKDTLQASFRHTSDASVGRSDPSLGRSRSPRKNRIGAPGTSHYRRRIAGRLAWIIGYQPADCRSPYLDHRVSAGGFPVALPGSSGISRRTNTRIRWICCQIGRLNPGS